MEKKFKLNLKGIYDLQQSLYALPDAKLAVEILIMRSDLQSWVKNKFDLTIDELGSVDEMSKYIAGYVAIKVSNHLAKREPINFVVVEFKGNQVKRV
jgi:hypothetical protein